MTWIKGIVTGVVFFIIGVFGMRLAGQPVAAEGTITVGYLFFLIGWLLGVGVWSYWALGWLGLDNKTPPTQASHGVSRYFGFSTYYKVIGI